MRTHRESVGDEHLAVCIHDIGFGHLGTVAGFDYHLVFETGLLVNVDTEVDILRKVAVNEASAHFADDNRVERVPFADYIAHIHRVSVVEIEFRTVRNLSVREHHLGVGIHDAHFCETSDYDLHFASVCTFFIGGNGAKFLYLKAAFVARSHAVDGRDIAGHTTDVERTECELCSGFADRLRSDYADSLAFLHKAAVGEVAAVALGAHALLAFASEH